MGNLSAATFICVFLTSWSMLWMWIGEAPARLVLAPFFLLSLVFMGVSLSVDRPEESRVFIITGFLMGLWAPLSSIGYLIFG